MNDEHHYFAASAFGWAVGPTRADAVRKAAEQAGERLVNSYAKQEGLHVFTCKVGAAIEVSYEIADGRPRNVPYSLPVCMQVFDMLGRGIVRDDQPGGNFERATPA